MTASGVSKMLREFTFTMFWILMFNWSYLFLVIKKSTCMQPRKGNKFVKYIKLKKCFKSDTIFRVMSIYFTIKTNIKNYVFLFETLYFYWRYQWHEFLKILQQFYCSHGFGSYSKVWYRYLYICMCWTRRYMSGSRYRPCACGRSSILN